MFVENMIQHGASSLRATTAESVIELLDLNSMSAGMADEDYAARASVDCVHDAEHNRQFFLPKYDGNHSPVTFGSI